MVEYYQPMDGDVASRPSVQLRAKPEELAGRFSMERDARKASGLGPKPMPTGVRPIGGVDSSDSMEPLRSFC